MWCVRMRAFQARPLTPVILAQVQSLDVSGRMHSPLGSNTLRGRDNDQRRWMYGRGRCELLLPKVVALACNSIASQDLSPLFQTTCPPSAMQLCVHPPASSQAHAVHLLRFHIRARRKAGPSRVTSKIHSAPGRILKLSSAGNDRIHD